MIFFWGQRRQWSKGRNAASKKHTEAPLQRTRRQKGYPGTWIAPRELQKAFCLSPPPKRKTAKAQQETQKPKTPQKAAQAQQETKKKDHTRPNNKAFALSPPHPQKLRRPKQGDFESLTPTKAAQTRCEPKQLTARAQQSIFPITTAQTNSCESPTGGSGSVTPTTTSASPTSSTKNSPAATSSLKTTKKCKRLCNKKI
jgi:hypothetical protein